jgi:hypothetical protein
VPRVLCAARRPPDLAADFRTALRAGFLADFFAEVTDFFDDLERADLFAMDQLR